MNDARDKALKQKQPTPEATTPAQEVKEILQEVQVAESVLEEAKESLMPEEPALIPVSQEEPKKKKLTLRITPPNTQPGEARIDRLRPRPDRTKQPTSATVQPEQIVESPVIQPVQVEQPKEPEPEKTKPPEEKSEDIAAQCRQKRAEKLRIKLE